MRDHLQIIKKNLHEGLSPWGGALRRVTKEEIRELETLGNIVEGADLWASLDFETGGYRFNRWLGRCVLSRSQVFFSTIQDSEIDSEVLIDHCPLIRRTLVGRAAVLRAVTVDCSESTSYGAGTEISAGLETSGRELPIHPALTLEEAILGSSDPVWKARVKKEALLASFDRSILRESCLVENVARLNRVWIDCNVTVSGALLVDNSTILAGTGQKTRLGAGVLIRDSILQSGVCVDSGAQIASSILLEHSHAERCALVTASLLGPGTGVGEGEVTASLLGPFVGFHHQSLLIAAWWPEGRGNIGYGANVGSNHTSRAPDQEIRPGEGTFFGLSTSIKFPSNFQGSPYTLIATGVTTLPQKMDMPFSLILDEPRQEPALRGLNRLIPGWVLRENVYSLLRNEKKYQDRHKAQHHQFDFRIFRPEVVDKLWIARGKLAQKLGESVYSGRDLPELGKNYLLEEDRLAAIETYDRFLSYSCVRQYADEVLHGIPRDRAFWDRLAESRGLSLHSPQQLLELWLEQETALLDEAVLSKLKDDRRGQEVIPDYKEVHGSALDDVFLMNRKESIQEWRLKAKSLVDNL